MQIPAKVSSRLSSKLKGFQKVLVSAKAKDVNESDTSLIISDMLSELFGYDKYSEITTETAIRGTYCDLAIVINGKTQLLIEVKAIGLDLKEHHIKQATDYAANKGIDWVILTNGITWHVSKITFSKPIDNELVAEINILDLSARNKSSIEKLFLISKEGLAKSALSEFDEQRQVTNKHILGSIILTDNVLRAIKKELKTIYKNVKVELSDIKQSIEKNVCKREIFEGEEAEIARRKVNRSVNRQNRTKTAESIAIKTIVSK